MKNLRIILPAVLSAFILLSCEKAYEEDNGTEPPTTETENGTENNEGSGGGGWYDDEDDGDTGGFQIGDVVDVATFRSSYIGVQVWVKGYVVGAATGAYGTPVYQFEPPFKYSTAVLLADTPTVTDESEVISVCLTTKKALREILNLVDNPSNLGEPIMVFGFQETYLRIPGIKTVDGYEFPLKQ